MYFHLAPGRFSVILITCVTINVTVSSCARDPEDAVQNVDYYRAHPKDRQTLLARCTNDPGRLRDKPACINAQQAENLEGIGSMRSLPPMGLSKDSATASDPSASPTPPASR